MNLPRSKPVEELTHEELSDEYSKIGDELFFGSLPNDDKRDALYNRRMDLWNEMKSRTSFSLPDCPKCGNSRWSQTPGDPKECTDCGFEPQRASLIERIDNAWEEILSP